MRSRFFMAVLVVAAAMPAQVGFVAMEKPPSLPVIVPDVLPGEGWAPGPYSVHGEAEVFDTWRKLRHRITVVQAGGSVTLLSGLSEVSKPDVIAVTSPVPEFRLSAGQRCFGIRTRAKVGRMFGVTGDGSAMWTGRLSAMPTGADVRRNAGLGRWRRVERSGGFGCGWLMAGWGGPMLVIV